MKPLICDLPYPSTDTLTKDVRSGNIISFAYATLRGEITATLQYTYHHFYFDKPNPDYADTLMRIAIAEMKHIDILGTAMLNLGVCYAQSEALVRMFRTPNNTFPIYWLKNSKNPCPPFPR